jgi:MFS family permease
MLAQPSSHMTRHNHIITISLYRDTEMVLLFSRHFAGLVVNGFVNVVITTIERRYGLRSSQTGLVASGYDIASFLFLVPVTYFGGRSSASKPRWIGWGVVVMGLGSLVFALPQFLVGQYRAVGDDTNVCQIGNGTVQVRIKIYISWFD